MAKPRDKNQLSPFARALEEINAERPTEGFDVSGFFGPGERKAPIPKIWIRVPTKAEQDRAIANAVKYVHEISLQAHPASDALKADRDVVADAKAAAIIFEFCRSREDDDTEACGYSEWPAFPSPRWACENLTSEQIAILLNLANEYRFKQAPSPLDFDDDTVEDYLAICITQNNPEYLLVGLTREYLVQLAILFAAKINAARNEASSLRAENALLRLRLGVDDDVTVDDIGWRAAGIRYTPPGTPPGSAQSYLMATRDPDGFFHFGPREGIFLTPLDHAPSRDELRAFLDACMAGDIDTAALADLGVASSPEAQLS